MRRECERERGSATKAVDEGRAEATWRTEDCDALLRETVRSFPLVSLSALSCRRVAALYL